MKHIPDETVYDVIVVGSGPNGSVAAKELGEQGLNVLVLEAGPTLNPKQDLNGREGRDMMKRLYRHFVSGRQSVQSMHGGYWESNPNLFVDDVDNAYTTPEDKPFGWIRGRQVGGRSLTWGGVTLRLSDYEFKAASRDGYGKDWPIEHADLDPFYSKLERFFGVHGGSDGLEQLPDGTYEEGSPLTPTELRVKEAMERKWPERRMVISRGFRQPRFHKSTDEKPWPGLSTQANSLQAALDSGHVTLRSDAVVSHLLFDSDSRRARGVEYVHRVEKTKHKAYAKVVMLCASTIESVRLLLHSTEEHQSGGLRNASDALGRYIMGHVAATKTVFFPGMEDPKELFPLLGSDSFLIPRFRNLEKQEESFKRGYGLWGGLQRGSFLPGFLRKVGKGTLGFIVGHGEVLPQPQNRVTLSKDVVDAWGIPVAHIDCAWGENEAKMVQDMLSQMDEIIGLTGGHCASMTELFRIPLMGKHIRKMEQEMEYIPGMYVHEVGGARMGTSPEDSVVNQWGQLWEADNVFVTDGACWVSSGWQNPTLTEMAITARACDFIASEFKAGTL